MKIWKYRAMEYEFAVHIDCLLAGMLATNTARRICQRYAGQRVHEGVVWLDLAFSLAPGKRNVSLWDVFVRERFSLVRAGVLTPIRSEDPIVGMFVRQKIDEMRSSTPGEFL